MIELVGFCCCVCCLVVIVLLCLLVVIAVCICFVSCLAGCGWMCLAFVVLDGFCSFDVDGLMLLVSWLVVWIVLGWLLFDFVVVLAAWCVWLVV